METESFLYNNTVRSRFLKLGLRARESRPLAYQLFQNPYHMMKYEERLEIN